MEAVVARPIFIRELSYSFSSGDTDVVIIATPTLIIISPRRAFDSDWWETNRARSKDKKEKSTGERREGVNVEKNLGTERCWGGGGRMTGTEETINADPKDAWATWYWKSSFLREFSSLESAEPLDFYTANPSTSPCATHAILWTSILHDFVVTIVEREFPADIFRGTRIRFTCDPLLSRAHVNDPKRSSRKSSSYGECVILYRVTPRVSQFRILDSKRGKYLGENTAVYLNAS